MRAGEAGAKSTAALSPDRRRTPELEASGDLTITAFIIGSVVVRAGACWGAGRGAR
jgi:hypothetical protein